MSLENTERKIEIARFIEKRLEMNGVSPTTDEISRAFGISKATVSKYVGRLVLEGVFVKAGRYGLIKDSRNTISKDIAVIGAVACGKPMLASEDIIEYLPIEKSLSAQDFFGLVCEGESMIGAGIFDGDVVYVKRQSTADNGDIVVAMLLDEETGEQRATLKRFFRDEKNSRYILRAENPDMSDIITENVEILGVAYRVLKRLK